MKFAAVKIIKLQDNTVRLSAQEKDPVRPRYSPVDSFGDAPLQDQRLDIPHF